MTEMNLPFVGDRFNVNGQDGLFFVLAVDAGARTVTLLPDNRGPILNCISIDALTPYPKPNGIAI